MNKSRSANLSSSSGARRADSVASSSSAADDAQKKFGGAKGISSDMYFGQVVSASFAFPVFPFHYRVAMLVTNPI